MSDQYHGNEIYHHFGKTRQKETLSISFTNTSIIAKVTWTSSFVYLARKYKWTMSNVDWDIAGKLSLTDNKKYSKHANQVKIKSNMLQN